jgi:hypothetical protein
MLDFIKTFLCVLLFIFVKIITIITGLLISIASTFVIIFILIKRESNKDKYHD